MSNSSFNVNPSNNKQIKFNFHTGREKIFGAIAAVGLLIMIFGCPVTLLYIQYNWLTVSIVLAIGFLLLTGGLKLYQHTKDYLIFDTDKNAVFLHIQFFSTKVTQICQINEIKEVKLVCEPTIGTRSHSGRDRHYIKFTVRLDMPDFTIKESANKVVMVEEAGYQFNSEVAKLRDLAVEIAGAVGCKVVYDVKTPPDEQLQPEVS